MSAFGVMPLPCPWCGDDMVTVYRCDRHLVHVRCVGCQAEGPPVHERPAESSEDEDARAVGAWNRRLPPEP